MAEICLGRYRGCVLYTALVILLKQGKRVITMTKQDSAQLTWLEYFNRSLKESGCNRVPIELQWKVQWKQNDRSGADSVSSNEAEVNGIRPIRWKRVVFEKK